MIEYVIPENPDDRIFQRACNMLDDGQLIAFPTDTNWIVACSPWSKKGIDALYKFKGESMQKHFAFICESIAQASEVAVISDGAFRLIRNRVPGHYTFIFEATKAATKLVKASKTDHEVGIRIPPSQIALKLIRFYGKALISTNITREMLDVGESDEIYSMMIEDKLGHQISMILDPGEYDFTGQSTIIDFSSEGIPILIREGAGEVFF